MPGLYLPSDVPLPLLSSPPRGCLAQALDATHLSSTSGMNEKACPYCPSTLPSSNSCSKHIREKAHGRAREAAEKEVEPGTSTARTKWSQREIDLFKMALTKYGPDSNIMLANEIRTRTAAQVNVYKWRFFNRYPSWLSEHYHPAPPAGNTSNPRQNTYPYISSRARGGSGQTITVD